MIKPYAYIQVIRPVNIVIAFFSVFIGGFLSGAEGFMMPLLLASLSGALITGGANVINDVFDIEIDKINKPERMLPAGKMTIKNARIFAFILFISGVALSFLINPHAVFISFTVSIILYFYSSYLKRTVLWGNFTVAVITGLAFIYGGIAVNNIGIALLVGLFAFFFHFAREIIKDIEDMEGDRKNDVKTLPIYRGKTTAYIFTTVLITILVILTFIPLFTDWFSIWYFIIVGIGVDLFLVWVLFQIWSKPDVRKLGHIAFLMKLDMLAGLLAVFAGRL